MWIDVDWAVGRGIKQPDDFVFWVDGRGDGILSPKVGERPVDERYIAQRAQLWESLFDIREPAR